MSYYVVLDLDNTLICSRPADILNINPPDERNFYIKPIRYQSLMKVSIRKHFNYFINALKIKGYKIIVWSAGEETYVKDISSVIFKHRNIDHIFTFNHLENNGRKN
jgi:hypothetical protein